MQAPGRNEAGFEDLGLRTRKREKAGESGETLPERTIATAGRPVCEVVRKGA